MIDKFLSDHEPNEAEKIYLTRIGNFIPRNHTMQTVNGMAYNNGNHSCAVSQLAFIMFGNAVTVDLLRVCLFHDSPFEVITGDIVGPAKALFPKLRESVDEIEDFIEKKYEFMGDIDGDTHNKLKFLDYLELHLYCIESHALGNRNPNFIAMFENSLKLLHDYHNKVRKDVTVELIQFLTSYAMFAEQKELSYD